MDNLASFARGAGCIFIEMFQGQPLFPGVSNILEQLEKIWEVRQKFLMKKKKDLHYKLGDKFALGMNEPLYLLKSCTQGGKAMMFATERSSFRMRH